MSEFRRSACCWLDVFVVKCLNSFPSKHCLPVSDVLSEVHNIICNMLVIDSCHTMVPTEYVCPMGFHCGWSIGLQLVAWHFAYGNSDVGRDGFKHLFIINPLTHTVATVVIFDIRALWHPYHNSGCQRVKVHLFSTYWGIECIRGSTMTC